MDLLGDVLALSAVRGTVAASVDAGEPWGLRLSQIPGAAFHAITSGTVWLRMNGSPDVHLMPGDVALLPTGTAHSLSSGRRVALQPWESVASAQQRTPGATIRVGEGPTQTRILCASYRHDDAVTTPLFSLLPDLVHIRAADQAGSLEATVRLLAGELSQQGPATDVVLNRLVDVLLIQVLRTWLESQPEHRGSWLGAMTDPTLGAALTALHQQPAHPWTVDTLAAHVGVSRATLGRRFTDQIGESPNGYLTRWRMDLAAVRLRDTDDPVHRIAESVGYTSEHAFSRAFSRDRGQPPGRYRRETRRSPAPPARVQPHL